MFTRSPTTTPALDLFDDLIDRAWEESEAPDGEGERPDGVRVRLRMPSHLSTPGFLAPVARASERVRNRLAFDRDPYVKPVSGAKAEHEGKDERHADRAQLPDELPRRG